MAWQKSSVYLGQELPNSYWRIAEQNFSHTSKTCRVIFACYADSTAREANIGNVLDSRGYLFSGEDYLSLLSANDIRAKAYALSLAALDTPSGNINPDSTPIMQSLFANAVQV